MICIHLTDHPSLSSTIDSSIFDKEIYTDKTFLTLIRLVRNVGSCIDYWFVLLVITNRRKYWWCLLFISPLIIENTQEMFISKVRRTKFLTKFVVKNSRLLKNCRSSIFDHTSACKRTWYTKKLVRAVFTTSVFCKIYHNKMSFIRSETFYWIGQMEMYQ